MVANSPCAWSCPSPSHHSCPGPLSPQAPWLGPSIHRVLELVEARRQDEGPELTEPEIQQRGAKMQWPQAPASTKRKGRSGKGPGVSARRHMPFQARGLLPGAAVTGAFRFFGSSGSSGSGGDSQPRLTVLVSLCPLPVSLLGAVVVLRTHSGPGTQSHSASCEDGPRDMEVPAVRRAGAPA